MKTSLKMRVLASVVFGMIFAGCAVATVYLLQIDKNNDNISWLMFLTLVSFGLTIGNLVVLLLKLRQNKDSVRSS